jgi:hypothetical protein
MGGSAVRNTQWHDMAHCYRPMIVPLVAILAMLSAAFTSSRAAQDNSAERLKALNRHFCLEFNPNTEMGPGWSAKGPVKESWIDVVTGGRRVMLSTYGPDGLLQRRRGYAVEPNGSLLLLWELMANAKRDQKEVEFTCTPTGPLTGFYVETIAFEGCHWKKGR